MYPLKYVAELFVHFFSGGRLSPGARIESLDQLYAILAIYAVGFVAMCLLVVALNGHAYRKREVLGLNEGERYETRATMTAWLVVAGTGTLSFVLAVATPPSPLALPGWVYMLLPVLMPLLGRRSAGVRRGLQEGEEAAG